MTDPVTGHNPDILTCLANLSADEVFTPPKLASAMLDMLPPDVFRRPDTTFLDPVCKSGVFLREIARRLYDGLRDQMPDEQKRVDHILAKQVFGLATSELTAAISRRSVYCSKKADGKYSIATTFTTFEGNIRLPRTKHRWGDNRKCADCGASQDEYDRGEAREAYAYPFIHGIDPRELFNVQFDVIIGNPPYQLSDGGHGRAASPIYHEFVRQAKKLEPRYLTMIIPSRWFSGGKGLEEFRSEMLNDDRIRSLVDYDNFREAFPGVDVAGGVSYFLWDRDNRGLCAVTNVQGDERVTTERRLNEFPTFVRSSRAVGIVKKVLAKHGRDAKYLNSVVSPSKPFGIRGFYEPTSDGIPCWFAQRIGRKFAAPEDVSDDSELLDKWKLLIPKSPIAGQTDFSRPVRFYYDENTRIAKPGECCTESYLVAGAFGSEAQVLSFKSYLYTKIARFLLLQTVISQDVTRKNFAFVPDLGKYEGTYTDEMLRQRWNITGDEWVYIDSKIG
jgi:site-specific DNA-methyltransferase (adenine-specific)